jgi:transcriptional regulator with XRE-family HTH domain
MQTDGYHDFLLSVGDRMREARVAEGLSQEELAELTKLDRVTIGFFEQGRRSPRLQTLYVIAQALHVDMAFFFTTA